MAGPAIVVVGAGIVGAAAAWHLARRGARVTLLDGGAPGGGVTGRAFGWINVVHGVAGAQAPLRRAAVAAWHDLAPALAPATRPDWCGALTWQSDPAATQAFVAAQQAAGFDLRLLDRAEVRSLEPGLADPPALAAFAPGEGAADPGPLAAAICRAAVAAGARLRAGEAVLALDVSDGRMRGVVTRAGRIAADHTVLAAGLGCAPLLSPLGVALPVAASPAIRITLAGPRPRLRRIVSNPALELRQAGPGRLYAAEDYIDESAENGPEAVAQRLLVTARSALTDGRDLTLAEVVVGQRPMPADGRPLVGPLPGPAGLWLAVLHAGVTLGPLIARLLADELLDGAQSPLLADSRPGRFAALGS